jgi:hypothetical protein
MPSAHAQSCLAIFVYQIMDIMVSLLLRVFLSGGGGRARILQTFLFLYYYYDLII